LGLNTSALASVGEDHPVAYSIIPPDLIFLLTVSKLPFCIIFPCEKPITVIADMIVAINNFFILLILIST
jgi:hypothetical protein